MHSTFNMKEDELWMAVGNRDLDGVLRLLQQGGDPNLICGDGWVKAECAGKKGTGKPILHHAAWVGDLEIFRALVEAGGEFSSVASDLRGTFCDFVSFPR